MAFFHNVHLLCSLKIDYLITDQLLIISDGAPNGSHFLIKPLLLDKRLHYTRHYVYSACNYVLNVKLYLNCTLYKVLMAFKAQSGLQQFISSYTFV